MNSSQIENETRRCAWIAYVLPYLLAVWCCFALLQANTLDIPPLLVLAKTVGIVLFAIAVVHAILFVVIRKTPARELVLFAIVASVGLYGHCSGLFVPFVGKTLFLAVWFVASVGLADLFYRNDTRKVTTALIPVVLFGIGVTMSFQIAGIGLPVVNDARQVNNLIEEISGNDPLNDLQPATLKSDLPDIYYIIVDAYARADVLQQTYGFDNRPFTDSLRQRGFYIGDESRSNYNLTEISLASSMNMTYLHELELDRFQTRMPVRKMIKDSTVVRFLKRQGYQTIAFETGKSETQCDNFDQFVSCGHALNDFQDVLYYTSVLPRIFDWTGNSFLTPARRHGERTVDTLNSIPEAVPADAKPTFVFSHLLAPHPPFVFDAQGNDKNLHGYYLLSDGRNFTACHDYDIGVYRTGYRDQLAFINQKLIEMVDRIQSSDRRSIIIIQADHGPRMGVGAPKRLYAEVNAGRRREAFSILNAIYLPDEWKPDFYSSMTPVNTFGLIFNEVFETQLKRQPDESYFERKYTFENVTNETLPVKTANPGS